MRNLDGGGGHCCSEQGAADKSDGGQGRASVDTSIWVTAVLVGNHEERKERGPICVLLRKKNYA
uniref:Uncharacterized protein n=1 Tax=Oryza sativa subsp. japonica TaxID=39947 RepID=Q75GU6_ORYSJ|nr:hypothetical protein [Oryza sativa Japonica Group]